MLLWLSLMASPAISSDMGVEEPPIELNSPAAPLPRGAKGYEGPRAPDAVDLARRRIRLGHGLALAGPPLFLGGAMLIFVGGYGQIAPLLWAGIAVSGTGVVGITAGIPLALSGGADIWRAVGGKGSARRFVLPAVAIAGQVTGISVAVYATATRNWDNEWAGPAVAMGYLGGVLCSILWSKVAIGQIETSPTVWADPRLGRYGFAVTGRF